MPIYKSRIRFQGRKKKAKHGDGEKVQRRLVMTVHVNDSDSTLVDPDPLFVKKRLPFTEELTVLLRSNLSISLAARHNIIISSATPVLLHVEQQKDNDNDPSVSFLELAPIYRPIDNHPEQTDGYVIDDGHVDDANEHSASLLVAIETFVSVGGNDGSAVHLQATATFESVGSHLKRVNLDAAVDQDEYNNPPASLLAAAGLFMPAGDHAEPVGRISILTPVVGGDSLHAPLLVATRNSFIDYIEPVLRSPTAPVQHLKYRPTLLQRVVALFTGRRRCPTVSEEFSNTTNPFKVRQQWSTLSSSPLPPSLPQQATECFNTTLQRPKNPPLPNPVLNAHHPYRPVNEHLDAPFIEPAKPHKHIGDYSIAPDIFKPAEVHLGFVSPTSPVSPTYGTRRPNFAATLLDRDKTTWGNWYAKMSKPENLPFAKVHGVSGNVDQSAEETTEQQAWDAHATSFGQAQNDDNEHTSSIEISQNIEAIEHEAADRLRNHSGHCFGAVTGGVYPFQHGLIL